MCPPFAHLSFYIVYVAFTTRAKKHAPWKRIIKTNDRRAIVVSVPAGGLEGWCLSSPHFPGQSVSQSVPILTKKTNKRFFTPLSLKTEYLLFCCCCCCTFALSLPLLLPFATSFLPWVHFTFTAGLRCDGLPGCWRVARTSNFLHKKMNTLSAAHPTHTTKKNT